MTYAIMKLLAQASFKNDCNPTENSEKFLNMPHWYEYLPGNRDPFGKCMPTFDWRHPESLWGIGLALIDILLRIGALVAVGYVIWGGFQYMISQGEPDRTKSAKDTILNALIGLVIALVAATLVSFIGSSIK